MTGIERRSAFVPVPPSAANYSSNINISPDLFKLHHDGTEEYSNPSYYNQLPQSVVPPVSIHSYNRPSYNRTQLTELHNNELNSPFQQLNIPSSHIETYHHTTPNTQDNKVLVKVSDSTMVMADVKSNKSNVNRSRNKRKHDALSTLHRNIMGTNVELSRYSDKSDVSKKRKSKSVSTSTQGSRNNNNTQINIKVDYEEDDDDDEWDTKKEEDSLKPSKKRPSRSFSPTKVSVTKHVFGF